MNKYSNRAFAKLLWLLTLIAVSLSLLFSCSYNNKKEEAPPYIAETKEEIRSNIAACLATSEEEYDTVSKYLSAWGVGGFDVAKFSFFEMRFNAVYNYEDGMPKVEAHAKDTAELFLDNYYDEIDIKNVTELTDSLLTCFVDSLNDPYAIYRPPVETDDYQTDMSGKFGGIGVVIEYDDKNETIQVTTVYLDSPAAKAGIMVGDYIYAIDGVTVEEIGYRNAVYHIRGEIGTSVEITLLRGEDFVTVNAVRAEVEEINVDYSYDEENGIGYVQLVSFKDNTFAQFKKSVDALEELGAKGIIFDVRGNPGGYVYSVCDVISYLIPTGHTIVSYQYKGSMMTELISEADGKKPAENGDGQTDVDHTVNVPIVVICDEYTASAGEIFTSAIRDYRNDGMLDATIVGTNTYKKGIMQNTYSYSDGSSATFTVAYYNPPCGVNYHGVGVAPDVTVELPTPERDPETGEYLPIEDTQLKSAIEELQKLINAK